MPPRQSRSLLPDFLGVLESPLEAKGKLVGESVSLRGWAMHATGPIDAVTVEAPWLTQPLTLSVGLRRADVAAAFPEFPGAANSGFAGELTMPDSAGPTVSLRVHARRKGSVVHSWTRGWQRESPDAAWQRWWPAGVAAHAPATPLPAITWLIRPTPDASRAVTPDDLAAWQQVGGAGSCAVAVDDVQPPPAVATPWLGLVQAGDRPRRDVLGWLAQALAEGPDLVIADHDHTDAQGRAIDPVLKPGWHRLLSDHPDVGGRAWLLQARHWSAPDAPTSPHAAASPMALWLSRWAGSPAAAGCRLAQLRAPLLTAPKETAGADRYPTVSSVSPVAPPVAVIIPTCLADPALLARALDGLFASAEAQQLEVLLALNNLRGHTPEEASDLLARWPVTCVHMPGPFNWSAFNNAGARATRAAQLLFLNDDIIPTDTGWLSAMQACLAKPGIGAVGALLRYPDGRLQHAGIQVHGAPEPMCRHLFRFCSGAEPRVRRWLDHDLPVSAATGACLLTPRWAFDAVGGFDEQLPLVYNDVDYGLRLQESGWSSVVCAAATLCHHEGWSRGGLSEDEDRVRFEQRWRSRLAEHDPHGHPWLAIGRDDWMPDFDRPPLPIIESRDV